MSNRRLILALSASAAIAIIAYLTLSATFYVERFGHVPMSAPVILLMVLFAFKSVVRRGTTFHDAEVGDGSVKEGRE
ncbi:MAG: hypothetical protein HYX28_04285 [Candidatus Koribacter versatilis]|uniref:Uncharacterized protein n=1 Tax=Candidatus Korobacter versatilis TaxID=658062 RepID=A0A932A7P5_9BACT|nr:hypothetical protein [Candidatus Koribacter versatilis]